MYEKYYKFEINNNIYYILCKFQRYLKKIIIYYVSLKKN